MVEINRIPNVRIDNLRQNNQEKTPVRNSSEYIQSPVSFKGGGFLRGVVLAKLPFSKSLFKSQYHYPQPATRQDKERIADLIRESGQVHDVDYEINRVLYNVTTKKQAELVMTALQKKVDDKFLYNTYVVSCMVEDISDDETLQTAIEAVSAADFSLSRYIFPVLNTLKNENPDKYQYLLKSRYLMSYLNMSVKGYDDDNENLVLTSDVAKFPEIEDICRYLIDEKEYKGYFNVLTDLYFKDRNAYDYAMNSPVLLGNFFTYYPVGDCISTLNANSLKEIEKAYNSNTAANKYIREYVDNSDSFKHQEELSEYISQFKTDGPITLYRAERSTGAFESVNIEGTSLSDMTRKLVEIHYPETKQDEFRPSNGKYSTFMQPVTNLYDYINSRNELTLADAMLVAKYGDKRFVNEVLHKIEEVEAIDNRFKSVTFSESFADSWKHDSSSINTAKIKTKLTVLEGTEGVFDTGKTGQWEFILNNTDKEIQYQKASYDKNTNTFHLEAILRNI